MTMSPVKTTTITVTVNTDYGTVTLSPSSPLMVQAGEVRFDLEVVGSGPAGVRAFLGLLDHSKLSPTAATLADGFQDALFPLRDINGNELYPTFTTETPDGPVSLNLSVLFPAGSAFMNYPCNSVVIVDW
jgi:hypothetical protein